MPSYVQITVKIKAASKFYLNFLFRFEFVMKISNISNVYHLNSQFSIYHLLGKGETKFQLWLDMYSVTIYYSTKVYQQNLDSSHG